MSTEKQEEIQNEKIGFIARNAKVATVVAVFFGATSGIFGSLTAAPSMAIGFWRLTMALPFFIIPIVIKADGRKRLASVSKKNLMWCFIAGAFLFGHFFSWFNAVKTTNIASAAVLASLHPFAVLLITVFVYKKRVSWKSVAAILAAVAGGAVITGADIATLAGGHFKGNMLAVCAGLFMGFYFAVGDKVRKEVDGSLYVMLVFLSCWICFTAGMFITGTAAFGYTFMDYFYIACMAVLCQIGAHAVFNMCIGHVSSLYVSTWEAGEPVVSTILGIFALKQIPSAYEIAGCIIVVGALLYYNRQEGKNEL